MVLKHYATFFECGVVVVLTVGLLHAIFYQYAKLDPFGHVRRLAEDSKKSLHESIVVAAMADCIYTNTHDKPNASGYWYLMPDLLDNFNRYCIRGKLTKLTLRQMRYQLSNYCVSHNYRDCMDLCDELIFHAIEVVLIHDMDDDCDLNVVDVCIRIIDLTRLGR